MAAGATASVSRAKVGSASVWSRECGPSWLPCSSSPIQSSNFSVVSSIPLARVKCAARSTVILLGASGRGGRRRRAGPERQRTGHSVPVAARSVVHGTRCIPVRRDRPRHSRSASSRSSDPVLPAASAGLYRPAGAARYRPKRLKISSIRASNDASHLARKSFGLRAAILRRGRSRGRATAV